ncbi:hypothetical protein LKD70_09780, partial [Ruminococcus sp. CLA-AA-H200]
KKVSEDKTLLYFKYGAQSATIPVSSRIVALVFLFNCQRWDYTLCPPNGQQVFFPPGSCVILISAGFISVCKGEIQHGI